MFRALPGFKARYHYLTLVITSDFDEWKVLVQGPGVIIHGARQFTEAKAKDHARTVADDFIHQERKEDLPAIPAVDWTPLAQGELLNWRP